MAVSREAVGTFYRQDRALAREIIGEQRFIETHLCAAISVCEARDPKGLYKKAREGSIAEFTGITAPYEAPEGEGLSLDSACLTVEESVATIIRQFAVRFC